MKFSACGIEDNPSPDDRPSIRLTVLKDANLREHVDVPTTSSWQDMLDQVFKGSESKPLAYCDNEGDMVFLGSECEWEEAIKVVYQKLAPVPVTPEQVGLGFESYETNREMEISSNEDPMIELYRNPITNDAMDSVSSTPDIADNPPKWFTKHMEKFQMEMKCEIGKQFAVLGGRGKLAGLEAALLARHVPQLDFEMPSDEDSDQGLGLCPLKPPGFDEEFPLLQSDAHTIPEAQKPSADDVVHVGIFCQMCKSNIVGIRYKCGNCLDFDLCAACESDEAIHFNDHIFLKIRKPIPPTPIGPGEEKPKPLLKKNVYSKPITWAERKRVTKSKALKKILENMSATLNRSTSEELGEGAKAKRSRGDREPETGMVPRIENFLPVKSVMDAKFLFDETVPDGTKFLPGTVFTKKWRLVNFGCQPWNYLTKLHFLWGTKGFTPTWTEVDVPHLAPRQNGLVSVQYKAPMKPGFHESHWTLTHKGHRFGHRIWCNIEVVGPESSGVQSQEPENGESSNPNKGMLLEEIVPKEGLLEGRKSDKRRTIFMSESDTSSDSSSTGSLEDSDCKMTCPSETPDFAKLDKGPLLGEPPKLLPASDTDSELSDHPETAHLMNLTDENSGVGIIRLGAGSFPLCKSTKRSDGESSKYNFQFPSSKAIEMGAANDYSSVGSDAGSVVNVSSSSSDSEFVIVPMPCCFDVPFVGCDNDLEPGMPCTGEKKKPMSESSSVIFISPDAEEIPVNSPVRLAGYHDDCQQAACDGNCRVEKLSTKIDELAVDQIEGKVVKRVESANEAEQLRLSMETGETTPVASTSARDGEPEQMRAAKQAKLPSPGCAEYCHVSKPGDNKKRDSLVGAAASIFDSACSAISALQWVQIPPDDNGDYIDPNLASPTTFPFRCHVPSFTNPS